MNIKALYQESKDDGFGSIVLVGVITTILQILSIVAFLVLAIIWIITQDNSFGWALLWPVGVYVLTLLGALIFVGMNTIKAAKDIW